MEGLVYVLDVLGRSLSAMTQQRDELLVERDQHLKAIRDLNEKLAGTLVTEREAT